VNASRRISEVNEVPASKREFMSTEHHNAEQALRIEFHVEEHGYAFSYQGPPELYFGLTFDGVAPVTFPIVVDPQALNDSVNGDGEYAIFTCACGYSECAGITSGVHVRHGDNQVRWQSAYPEVDVVFASSEYNLAIQSGIERAEELVRTRPELEGWMPPRLRG